MTERRMQEFALVEAAYGEMERSPSLDWFVIKHWPLPPGWNKRETAVLVLIPSGYPLTPPDNVYTDADLYLADGRIPGNADGVIHHNGHPWRQFSYHVEPGDWQPHADLLRGHNVLTFLEGVAQRLAEVS
jgi:hypothetical protein